MDTLLPNFLLIGAAKSGTTALHEYLGQHPDIFMTIPKEPRFFYVWENPQQRAIHEREKRGKFNYYHTIERYNQLFENGRNHAVRGESSTAYLANPGCAAKIKKLVPNVKLIAILRNPVERAFSNYLMYNNWKLEKKSFEDAVNEEIRTGRENYQQPMRYLYLGKYANSLKTYYSLFPAGQIRIYLYDELQTGPLDVIRDIFQFLDVNDSFVPDISRKHNVSVINRFADSPNTNELLNKLQRGFKKFDLLFLEESVKRVRFYKPALERDVRKKLLAYYDEEISVLEKLLNRDLSKWREI